MAPRANSKSISPASRTTAPKKPIQKKRKNPATVGSRRLSQCPLCNYTTRVANHLQDHLRGHVRERKHKCEHPNCEAAFPKKYHLQVHQLVHNKDDESLLKFKCSICPYRTGLKSSLHIHLKTHSDIKEFSCYHCSYKSSRRENIKRHHTSVHSSSSEKPFKCPQHGCHYSCKVRGDLSKHLIMHWNDKPFVCSFAQCDYKTRWKKELKQHVKRHRFHCPTCNLLFTKHQLAAHIRAHHTAEVQIEEGEEEVQSSSEEEEDFPPDSIEMIDQQEEDRDGRVAMAVATVNEQTGDLLAHSDSEDVGKEVDDESGAVMDEHQEASEERLESATVDAHAGDLEEGSIGQEDSGNVGQEMETQSTVGNNSCNEGTKVGQPADETEGKMSESQMLKIIQEMNERIMFLEKKQQEQELRNMESMEKQQQLEGLLKESLDKNQQQEVILKQSLEKQMSVFRTALAAGHEAVMAKLQEEI